MSTHPGHVVVCKLYAFMGYNDRADIRAGGTPELFYFMWVREEDLEEMTEWFRQTLTKYGRKYKNISVKGRKEVPVEDHSEKEELKKEIEKLIREEDQTPDFDNSQPGYPH